jgi:16S rRNA (cytosine1402-N4)-methyltransferase
MAAPVQQPEAHIPVLRDEVLTSLSPKDTDTILDGTFGAGGYSRALLESSNATVYAIDRDPSAIARGKAMEQEFDGRLHIMEGCFSQMEHLLKAEGISSVDGVVLDVGVSSMQLDQAERGFSFKNDGPLDMRMSSAGVSAADVVNSFAEAELAEIFLSYGEEKHAGLIARAIVRDRDELEFTTTKQLASLVERLLRPFTKPSNKKGKKKTHPATKVFQALRIYVNDEIGELERGLDAAKKILAPGGRLAIVSFHSLEDRLVKTFLLKESGNEPKGSRHLPDPNASMVKPCFKLVKKGTIKPSEEELVRNPRSRSSRLRVAMRTDEPVNAVGVCA